MGLRYVQLVEICGLNNYCFFITNDYLILDQHWVSLTSNTINFSKAYLTFLDDALKLPFRDCHIYVDEILHDIFQAQLLHVDKSLRSGKYKGEVF